VHRVITLVFLLITANTNAAPVTWTLNGVTFDDMGTASGSFVYNVDTNIYSDIAITTSGGTYFDDSQLYTLINPDEIIDAKGLHLVAESDPQYLTRAFNFNFASYLTNQGGTVLVATPPPPTAFETRCASDLCRSYFSGRRVTAGSISAVPIPAAVWLFGSGLGLLGWFRRRQSA